MPFFPAVTTAIAPSNRVVYLGDSITMGSHQNATNYQATSYPLFASMLSRGRALMVRNAGIAGDTTAQMLARFNTDVAPYVPRVVMILGGTNDVGQGTVGLTTYQANIRSLADRCVALGALPVFGTIPPNNDGTRKQKIATWNHWLRRFTAIRGYPLVDFYAALVDPANGSFQAAYTSDGTHPLTAGAVAMGQVVADKLVPLLPSWSPPLPVDNADTSIMFSSNAILLTDTNADGVPDGWYAYGGSGVTHTTVTDSQVPGRLMQFAASGASGTRVAERSVNASGNFSAGDVLAACGVITSDGGVQASVKLDFVGAGSSAVPALFTAAVTRGVYYQEVVVPAGTTSMNYQLITGAGTGTVAFGQPSVTNLTTRGIL